jgi:hypothetical protein
LQRVAMATARTNLFERNYRAARSRDERETGDRERLEALSIRREPTG